jgi:hypothetical protein
MKDSLDRRKRITAVDSARLLNTRSLGFDMIAYGAGMPIRLVGQMSGILPSRLGHARDRPSEEGEVPAEPAALNQSWIVIVPSGTRLTDRPG